MARRLLFGSALGVIVVAAVASLAAWISGNEPAGWIRIAAIFGGTVLAFAIALTSKDLMSLAWKAARERKVQAADLASLAIAVDELRQDGTARDSVVSAQLIVIRKIVDKLERTQTDDIGTALNRIERTQTDDIGTALNRIEHLHGEEFTKALGDIRREQDAGYHQIESHTGLMTAMNLKSPLPAMRKTWSIAPDSAAFLVRTIADHRVRTVLECGSGISTVLVAQALERIDQTAFTSLEQDPEYLDETLSLLRSEGLEDHVDLVLAPLKETIIEESAWQWYDDDFVKDLPSLDLVIVDGPPHRTGPLARYPALPIVASKLNKGALIFLDDARRGEEREVLRRWTEEFPVVALTVPKLENGVGLLQWTAE